VTAPLVESVTPVAVGAGKAPLSVLFLAEGDAETRDSWSGTAVSVVTHLRKAGHAVRTADVDLYGWPKWTAAARSYSPDRARWSVRYRLGAAGFDARSRQAARHFARVRDRIDVVFQIGATFEPRGRGSIPYVLYCDSNIRVAQRGTTSGQSHAMHLPPAEMTAIQSREAAIYRGASAILTISEQLRRSFVEDFGIDPARVHAVHAGPNLEVGAGLPAHIPDRSSGPPTILFVGRQFQRKGGDVLLSAFRLVREQVRDAELVIVGPTECPTREPGVTWLGFLSSDDPVQRERLATAYRAAHVFCLPTRFEPFGIVFLEAMHWGLPCVGTSTGAVPEMIADGRSGYTVPADDPVILADRLCQLLRDRSLASRMGQEGHHRAVTYFTWPAVVARMTAVLHQVVERA